MIRNSSQSPHVFAIYGLFGERGVDDFQALVTVIVFE